MSKVFSLAALLVLLAATPTLSAPADPWADPEPNPALAANPGAPTPLLSVGRIYPYVGVEERWTFSPYEYDYQDLIWHVGAAYSLGAVAPSLTWRWNPEPGADVNELVLGLRLNLRGVFK